MLRRRPRRANGRRSSSVFPANANDVGFPYGWIVLDPFRKSVGYCQRIFDAVGAHIEIRLTLAGRRLVNVLPFAGGMRGNYDCDLPAIQSTHG